MYEITVYDEDNYDGREVMRYADEDKARAVFFHMLVVDAVHGASIEFIPGRGGYSNLAYRVVYADGGSPAIYRLRESV